MATNYSNATYIDLTQLQTPPNITLDINTSWSSFETGIQSMFTTFSWLEVAQSLGVFIVFYVLFSNQKILNLTNMQIIMAASFMTVIFSVGMLYTKYHTSFHMLGAFFLLWLISLISTIRDS